MAASDQGVDPPYGALVDLARAVDTDKADVYTVAEHLRSWRLRPRPGPENDTIQSSLRRPTILAGFIRVDGGELPDALRAALHPVAQAPFPSCRPMGMPQAIASIGAAGPVTTPTTPDRRRADTAETVTGAVRRPNNRIPDAGPPYRARGVERTPKPAGRHTVKEAPVANDDRPTTIAEIRETLSPAEAPEFEE